MATDPNANSGLVHDGDGKRRAATKWLLAGAGFAWLLTSALRRRRNRPDAVETYSDSLPRAVAESSPRKGHELRDANAAWIFGAVIFLFISGLTIHFLLAAWLSSLKRSAPPTDRWHPSQQVTRAEPSPSAYPHLQIAPPLDLGAFRKREEAELSSYGWVNRTAGIVRIPIQRAMELVLQEGLPTRTSTNENQTGPSEYDLIRQRLEHREPESYRNK